MEFPTGMLGVALGTILLPSLSKSYTDNHDGEYSQLMDWGLRLTFILALPAAVALAVLAVPLVTSLFHYGQFSVQDVWMTRQALMAYSLGLLGLILVKVLAPGFYARQDIKTPVKIAIVTLCATQLMNLMFISPFKHAGLALSIGLGACLNAGLLFRALRRAKVYQPQPGWRVFFLKLGLAVVAMALILQVGMGSAEQWLQYHLAERFARLVALVMVGAATYFSVLWILGFRIKQYMRRTVA
jgi:putative peptidoglycan lipid II flippase